MFLLKRSSPILLVILLVVFSACQWNTTIDEQGSTEIETQDATLIEAQNTTLFDAFGTTSPDAQYSTNVIIQETVLLTNPPAITTSAVSTALSLSGKAIQTAELKALFNEYQKTMLELSKPLIEKNIQFADIDNGFSAQLYVDETFDKAMAQKFKDYLLVASAETKHDAAISVRMEDGKRVITFSFSAMDGSGSIVYMPDGYVNLPLVDPKSEAKLADKWYSYYA